METEALFPPRATPVIRALIAIIVIFSLFSCATLGKPVLSEDPYKIINIALSEIQTANPENKIYIDTSTNNALFIEELNSALLVNRENQAFHFLNNFLPEDELLAIFGSDQIRFMTKQLNAPFVLNVEKINIRNVFKYQEPLKKANEEKTVTEEITKIFYRFSKPVFTLNAQYSIILISKRYSGHWIEIHQKQDEKWIPYKKIGLGIY